jgi:uncharacterized protein (DUF433 family)
MGYPAPLAAALSGATLGQLAYWRKTSRDHGPLLAPEYGTRPRAIYSYRDIIALRMFVQLRGRTSLQRIRKAVSWLQERHPTTHLSAHQLKATPRGKSIVWISTDGDYFDVVERPGQAGIAVVMEDIFRPFQTAKGRNVPGLREPAPGVTVDAEVRGGYPVIAGTRVPFDIIAGLYEDGLDGSAIRALYPSVPAKAVEGAAQLAEVVARVSEPVSRAA